MLRSLSVTSDDEDIQFLSALTPAFSPEITEYTIDIEVPEVSTTDLSINWELATTENYTAIVGNDSVMKQNAITYPDDQNPFGYKDPEEPPVEEPVPEEPAVETDP